MKTVNYKPRNGKFYELFIFEGAEVKELHTLLNVESDVEIQQFIASVDDGEVNYFSGIRIGNDFFVLTEDRLAFEDSQLDPEVRTFSNMLFELLQDFKAAETITRKIMRGGLKDLGMMVQEEKDQNCQMEDGVICHGCGDCEK